MTNTGSSTWGSGYQLVFYNGDQLGAPAAVSLPSASPGQTVDISTNITAPTHSGSYTSYWRLRSPSGIYFCPVIWAKITVGAAATATPGGDITITGTYPSVVRPGQTFQPQVTVHVNQGQLLESRGDMLRNTDGNLYGAWPHVAVTGSVNAGQSYTFVFYADNPIHAPSAEGTYESHWRVWRDGNWSGPGN